VPVETSPLIQLSAGELQQEIESDLSTYQMLREAADDLTQQFKENGLLGRAVDSLSEAERLEIRRLWRDGVMAFVEADLLKSKYSGFMQIDHKVQPALHADAFFIAYASYICQYDACLKLCELVGKNEFMETLLNEPGEGIPAESYFAMKLRLTHPEVILRLNAGTAYYELVKKDITVAPELKADFEARRRDFFKRQGKNPELFIENPLDVLERGAFKAWLPVQKNIAVQMSYIRTAQREYFITPEILAEYRDRLQPGDILVERRNWHMTNIGIPGFWPHVALYVGTLDELDASFDQLGFLPSEKIKELYPAVYAALGRVDEDGYPLCVLESIRPGVIFQSLEKSAKCDYLGVVRPDLPQLEKFNALLAAFSHVQKPYDLNFDFTTDNVLVCSELIYKAFQGSGKLPLKPEVINGRLLLPPNRMVEQIADHLNDSFSFVLFLDASEKEDRIVEGNAQSFADSWARPKWDVMQK
ncbi:MAG: YiiX/YebB-like N1pC/P60 family cysteine hydrolase, partial [Kiritimatiellaceae bacterium]|nr:YiiX/YebB-like N1pC/P60 family cysteine hydrolase [Kiritimatiellaceae bacterium]